MKLEVGMYVRTKYGITQYRKYNIVNQGEIICMPVKDGSRGIFANIEDIIKASYKLGELLRVGDFLDNHCIVKIENTTIFLNDGWFIDFDDLEDLVTTVCTKEQFERVSYEVGE